MRAGGGALHSSTARARRATALAEKTPPLPDRVPDLEAPPKTVEVYDIAAGDHEQEKEVPATEGMAVDSEVVDQTKEADAPTKGGDEGDQAARAKDQLKEIQEARHAEFSLTYGLPVRSCFVVACMHQNKNTANALSKLLRISV